MNNAWRAAWVAWDQTQPLVEKMVTRVGLGLLLRTGQAPTIGALAAELVQAEEKDVARILETMASRGLATLDGDRLTGIGGLSVVPGPHHLQWNQRQFWTWCALDAVGIPAALNGQVRVESSIFPDGEPVTLAFQDGKWVNSQVGLGIQMAPPETGRPLNTGT